MLGKTCIYTFASSKDVSLLKEFLWWDMILIPLGGALSLPLTAPNFWASSPPPALPPCPILPHFIALLNADNWWQMDCAAHCESVALGVSCGPRAGKEGIGGKGEGSPCSSKAPGTGGWKSIQIRPLIGPDSARAVECGNPLSATHTAKLDDGAEEVQRGEGGPKTCYSTLFHIIKTTFGQGDKATLQTQNTHRINENGRSRWHQKIV